MLLTNPSCLPNLKLQSTMAVEISRGPKTSQNAKCDRTPQFGNNLTLPLNFLCPHFLSTL